MSHALGEFASAQQAWSEKTFGPNDVRGPLGPLKHLEKEAREAQEAVGSDELLEELADCLFLVVDATWRAGFWTSDLLRAAFDKLDKNKAREWPAITPGDNPVEHVR